MGGTEQRTLSQVWIQECTFVFSYSLKFWRININNTVDNRIPNIGMRMSGKEKLSFGI